MEGTDTVRNATTPPTHITTHDTGYELTLVGGDVELVPGADAYAQEGPLTTFFDTAGRDVIDSWAVRLLSVRTVDIAMVKRLGARAVEVSLPMVVGGQFSRTFDGPIDSALAS